MEQRHPVAKLTYTTPSLYTSQGLGNSNTTSYHDDHGNAIREEKYRNLLEIPNN